VGSVQILLPNDVGVKVDVTGGLGQVTALNLSREGGSYVNAAYGESPVTINLAVEGGIGQVDMEVLQ
jgi:predicted membrane protein